jgi:hypothetical protein
VWSPTPDMERRAHFCSSLLDRFASGRKPKRWSSAEVETSTLALPRGERGKSTRREGGGEREAVGNSERERRENSR